MFAKPVYWQKMTDQDRAWTRTVTKGNLRDKLSEAVELDSLLRLEFLKHKFSLSRDGVMQALRKAIAADKGDIVRALLACDHVMFNASADGDKLILTDLYSHAAKARAEKSFDIIDACNLLRAKSMYTSYGSLDRDDVARVLVQNEWFAPAQKILSRTPSADASVFSACLDAALVPQVDIKALDFVLAWQSKFSGTAALLNQGLIKAVATGSAEKVKLLLDRGADANTDGAQAMLHAVQNNREDIVRLLLQGGFDRQKYGADVLRRLAGKSVNEQLCALIEPVRNPYSAEMPDPQILCEGCVLSGGLKLTTVFNFRTRQQLVICERADAAPASMVVTAQNFCDMKDKDVIAAAAQRLTDLGGQPSWTPSCSKINGLRLQ
jgi:hypothetical protein